MNIEQIYQDQVNRVFGFYYAKTLDRNTAEDLTSRTFMTFVEKQADPELVIQNPQAFISGLMRNIWLQYLQEKYRHKEFAFEAIEEIATDIDDTIERLENEGLKAYATRFIDQLPDKQRTVLTMRLIENKSLKAICNELDKDMNYVRTTQKRGIRSLKDLIALNQPTEGKEQS